jgi:hypothetical protein
MALTCIPGSVLCGLGLPEILLWVLVFAVVFGILNIINIFSAKDKDGKVTDGKSGKKINAIVALVLAFFVMMAAPTALVGVMTSMTNSFVVIAITLVLIVAMLQIGTGENYLNSQKKWVSWILIGILVLVFVGAGGLAFIGIGSIAAVGITLETVVLALVVIAVLYLILS